MCVSGGRSWWRWGNHGTPRSSRALTALCLWASWVLWRNRALFTASTAMRSSSPRPVHAASSKSWGSVTVCFTNMKYTPSLTACLSFWLIYTNIFTHRETLMSFRLPKHSCLYFTVCACTFKSLGSVNEIDAFIQQGCNKLLKSHTLQKISITPHSHGASASMLDGGLVWSLVLTQPS